MGLEIRLIRGFFLGDGVVDLLSAPGRVRAVCLRFWPLFCNVATRSAASDIETGDAGRFLLEEAFVCEGIEEEEVARLIECWSGRMNCSLPLTSVRITPLFRFKSLTS